MSKPPRRSLALDEGILRLREIGVTGDDDDLVALLEAACFDVDRAANLFMDHGGAPSEDVADIMNSRGMSFRMHGGQIANVEDLDVTSALGGCLAASQRVSAAYGDRRRRPARSVDRLPKAGSRPKPWKEAVAAESTCVSVAPGASLSLSQKKASRARANILRIQLIGDEDDASLPSGVQYTAHNGETYEISITKMEQTHLENGSVRKIQRLRPTLWRFFMKGDYHGAYPADVQEELEQIFLARNAPSSTWARDVIHPASSRNRAVARPKEIAKLKTLPSGVVPSAEDLMGIPLASIVTLERSLPEQSLALEALTAILEILLAAAESGGPADAGDAAALLKRLATRHGLRCSIEHARRAGLVIGSMQLLRAVLVSTPDLCLVGADIFDKRYAKLKMNDSGRKNSIRCLLARGMRLGSKDCTPSSKLLRKVEEDAAPQWTTRWLDSAMLAYPTLPESMRSRVLAFVE